MGQSEPIGDTMAYGNHQGLALLQELESAKEDRAEIKRMMAANAAALAQLAQFKEMQMVKNEIFEDFRKSSMVRSDDTSDIVHLLAASSDAYMDIRNRFMDVYRRDKMNQFSSAGTKTIAKGNLKAHGGDCLIDALLFHSAKRSDADLFVDIYGISVDDVLLLHQFKNFDAIAAINKYGTLKAEKGQCMPEELIPVYDQFIKALLTNPSTKLTADQQSSVGGLYLRYIGMISNYQL